MFISSNDDAINVPVQPDLLWVDLPDEGIPFLEVHEEEE